MPSASSPHLVRRILDQLEAAEAHELNPHLQCDYRIAWITVLNAAAGNPQPNVAATYAVLGLHPDKVWPAIIARRQGQCGPLYEAFWGVELPPKKPPQSAKVDRRIEKRAA